MKRKEWRDNCLVSQYLMKRKEGRHNWLCANLTRNEKPDDIIDCLPMLDEMKRLTS